MHLSVRENVGRSSIQNIRVDHRFMQQAVVVFLSVEPTALPHFTLISCKLRGRKHQQGALTGRTGFDWLSPGTRSLASYCTATTIRASTLLPSPFFVCLVSLIYAHATCTQPSANITLQRHAVMTPAKLAR